MSEKRGNKTNLEQGILAENYVIEQIKKEFSDNNLSISHNKTHGVDIILKKNEKELKIEVKSAKRFIRQYRKKLGKYTLRSGNFYLIPNQMKKADIFAFVIIHKNSKRLYYVKLEYLMLLLKKRKNYMSTDKKKRLIISINQLKELKPKVQLRNLLNVKNLSLL